MNDEKSRLREEMLKKRKGISTANRVILSATILERLFGLEEVQRAGCVAFYASYGSEVETQGMMAHGLVHGKRISVPKVQSDRTLIFFEIDHPVRDLRPGWKGIPEPHSDSLRRVEPANIDLLVVPGIAYDEEGNRLGQGAGFYDRLLAKLAGEIPVVALAFDLQIISKVPAMARDVQVDIIVTEKRVIDCRRKTGNG